MAFFYFLQRNASPWGLKASASVQNPICIWNGPSMQQKNYTVLILKPSTITKKPQWTYMPLLIGAKIKLTSNFMPLLLLSDPEMH